MTLSIPTGGPLVHFILHQSWMTRLWGPSDSPTTFYLWELIQDNVQRAKKLCFLYYCNNIGFRIPIGTHSSMGKLSENRIWNRGDQRRCRPISAENPPMPFPAREGIQLGSSHEIEWFHVSHVQHKIVSPPPHALKTDDSSLFKNVK